MKKIYILLIIISLILLATCLYSRNHIRIKGVESTGEVWGTYAPITELRHSINEQDKSIELDFPVYPKNSIHWFYKSDMYWSLSFSYDQEDLILTELHMFPDIYEAIDFELIDGRYEKDKIKDLKIKVTDKDGLLIEASFRDINF